MGRKSAPVFVVGCPRSGTTLLYHMLLSSGGFAVYRAESNVFNLLVPRFGNLRRERNKRELARVWLATEHFRLSSLDPEMMRTKIMGDCRNGGDLLKTFMAEIARFQNVDRWADTTPDHLLYQSQIKASIPDALIIHIVRDGRDVALSSHKLGWVQPFSWDKKYSLYVQALYWAWTVTKGRQASRKMPQDYMEVHFEDLVCQPRETLANLGHFIEHDLDYDRILQSGIGSVREPNTSFKQESEATGFSPVNRWKQRLSSAQVAALEGLIGSALREFGYPLVTSTQKPRVPLQVRIMGTTYPWWFSTKFWLRLRTPLGRFSRLGRLK